MDVDNSFRYTSNMPSTSVPAIDQSKKLGQWMYSSTAETDMCGSSYGLGFDDEKSEKNPSISLEHHNIYDERSSGDEDEMHSSPLNIEGKRSFQKIFVSPKHSNEDENFNLLQQHHPSKPFPINNGCRQRLRTPNMNIKMSTTYQIPVLNPEALAQSSSRAISLPSTHIPRTQSEQQLRDDTAAAEWRDLCMFHRLVGGIRERQVDRWRRRQTYSSSPNGVECDKMIERSIANIVRYHQEDLNSYDEEEYFIEDRTNSLFEYNNQAPSMSNIPFYDDDEPLQTDDTEDVFTMDL